MEKDNKQSGSNQRYSPRYIWNEIPYTFAFQPIVNVEEKKISAYEALLRGRQNEGPTTIFSRINEMHMIDFVKQLNTDVMFLAAKLGIDCDLNLNFLPSGLQTSEHFISEPMKAAQENGLRLNQIVIEITEKEAIVNPINFTRIINAYRSLGVKVAIDDFGAGYSGLNLLANFQPDLVKLDMMLVRDIESHGPRQAIVDAINQVCFDLGIDLIAEGVETIDEFAWLRAHGIRLFQGFLFAKPGFENLPEVFYPTC